MYATDHGAAACELARCAAPDARVVLASWSPGSFMPAMGQALSEFVPPPPASSGPPSRWGDVTALEELLASAGLRVVEHAAEHLTMTFEDSASAARFLVRTAGHVVAERERLRRAGRWDDVLSTTRQLVDARCVETGGRIARRLRVPAHHGHPSLAARAQRLLERSRRRTSEVALAPGLVRDDAHRIREVQAAVRRAHRDVQAMRRVGTRPATLRRGRSTRNRTRRRRPAGTRRRRSADGERASSSRTSGASVPSAVRQSSHVSQVCVSVSS